MYTPLQAEPGDTVGLVSDHHNKVSIAVVSHNLFTGGRSVTPFVKYVTSAQHNETKCACNSGITTLRSISVFKVLESVFLVLIHDLVTLELAVI